MRPFALLSLLGFSLVAVGCNQPASVPVDAISHFHLIQTNTLSSELLQALNDPARFHEVKQARNLPAAILAICVDENGQLAEPGQSWSEGDVRQRGDPPSRRMMWAAQSGHSYVVQYQGGGIGTYIHLLKTTYIPGNNTLYGSIELMHCDSTNLSANFASFIAVSNRDKASLSKSP